MNDIETENPVDPPPPTKKVKPVRRRSWFSRLLRKRSDAERQALALPTESRWERIFSMVVFFGLGALLTAFVVINPLGLAFLPQLSGGSSMTAGAAEPVDTGKAYQCPMHPEVIESHPDVCPICGMKLVEVKQAGGSRSQGSTSAMPEGEREILYWYAPMDATFVRDEPGLSPMGMKLVPKYADQASGGDDGAIQIDPVQVQNIGVVSEKAILKDIARTSRTVGILDFNADKVTWINTKFEGWIEKVYVNYVGQEVHADQPLFDIYSPELVTTQEEYLRALDYRRSLENSSRDETRRQAESLVRSTRERLEYWDVSEGQIERLGRTREVQRRLTIYSPASGVVAEVMNEALKGTFVRPGMNLYKIVDLSSVWVHADVFESELPWIHAGQPAFISFPNNSDTSYRGNILFLYPEVSSDTRTLKICIEVPNKDDKLRPGMYADVIVSGPTIKDAVVIPRSAVLRSGERDLVFLDLGEGRFLPREVQIGPAGESNAVQVLSGIQVGDSVVTQAQFMLDSESRIQEAIAKFMNRDSKNNSESGSEPDSHAGHGI